MQLEQVTSELHQALGIAGFPREEGAAALVHSLAPACRVREVRGLTHAFLWRSCTGAIIYSAPGDWLGQSHEGLHVLSDTGLAALLGRYACVTAALACQKEEAAVNKALRAFLMPLPLCYGLEAWELAECAAVPLTMAQERLTEIPSALPTETGVGPLSEEEELVRHSLLRLGW